MQRDVLPSADAHPQLQAFQPIQPSHTFSIYHPPLASQQHPDPQKAKPRPRVCELADAQPQRPLIAGVALAIPRRATELRQLTGPQHADAVGGQKPRGQLTSADGP